jgi:hypothetical protein
MPGNVSQNCCSQSTYCLAHVLLDGEPQAYYNKKSMHIVERGWLNHAGNTENVKKADNLNASSEQLFKLGFKSPC